MDKLRVGVVGVGYLGRFHALIYSRLPGSGPLGGRDEVPERRARGTCEDRKRHGCRLRAYRDVFTACPSRSCAPAAPVSDAGEEALALPYQAA